MDYRISSKVRKTWKEDKFGARRQKHTESRSTCFGQEARAAAKTKKEDRRQAMAKGWRLRESLLWTRKEEIAIVSHRDFLYHALSAFGNDCDPTVKSEICKQKTGAVKNIHYIAVGLGHMSRTVYCT
ncbi:hypothetical protein K1719_002543 [Acacia pycnantha]|nr:hypothetical protein K1719_002543 [Acacia pycnantha]